jgi:DNA-3-methyladenine glycosylase
MKLDQAFYCRSSVTQIAMELLGKTIYTNFDGKLTGGIITETEAYEGITDKASHAYNNRRTDRTKIMYDNGGFAYVYLCYGMHHLFNFVTNKPGIPHAVLLRGIQPIEGISIMEERTNKKVTHKGFADGPGKCSKALDIKTHHTGVAISGDLIWVEDHAIKIKKKDILVTPRIGVDYAGEDALLPYRYLLNIPEKRAKKNPTVAGF